MQLLDIFLATEPLIKDKALNSYRVQGFILLLSFFLIVIYYHQDHEPDWRHEQ